jgi:heterodisulfide reductase subunit B
MLIEKPDDPEKIKELLRNAGAKEIEERDEE